MSWDGARGDGTPPGVRRLDCALTYESFDHGANADEHDNGQNWSATLWDIWNALTRRVADRIIIDSHFQLDGFTSFARGARAILDAGSKSPRRTSRRPPPADLPAPRHRTRGIALFPPRSGGSC